MPDANTRPPSDQTTAVADAPPEDGENVDTAAAAPAGASEPSDSAAAASTEEAAGEAHEAGGTDKAAAADGGEGGRAEDAPEAEAGGGPDEEPDDVHRQLTPREARRKRSLASAGVMVLVALVLVARLGSTPSLLTVACYGFALVLSGIAVVLSRLGRTRVATAVLGLGFASVLFAEWLLVSATAA